MYKVIKYFTDLQDNNHEYKVGDTYPRQGLEASQERIACLAGSNNLQKQPLIEKPKKPNKKTGKDLSE